MNSQAKPETETVYTSGHYLRENPTWHVEDSPWKAGQILRMLRRNNLTPTTMCEVGCGAGEILAQLQQRMSQPCTLYGYEISPQAFELCQQRANEHLHFKLQDILTDHDVFFDIILIMDVIEHLEDYFGFMRGIHPKSTYKIFNIPLDISLQSVLRVQPITRKRTSVGHIHYFTKEIALDAVKDAGYEIRDYFYAAGDLDLPAASLKNALAKLPRKVVFTFNQDLAARVMGGFSLMILAK
jgi:SAM-dependent methyltransferase